MEGIDKNWRNVIAVEFTVVFVLIKWPFLFYNQSLARRSRKPSLASDGMEWDNEDEVMVSYRMVLRFCGCEKKNECCLYN